MKSETFRKQALSLIVFFVAIAAVFALTRLRSDPAGKQAQTILYLPLEAGRRFCRRSALGLPQMEGGSGKAGRKRPLILQRILRNDEIRVFLLTY